MISNTFRFPFLTIVSYTPRPYSNDSSPKPQSQTLILVLNIQALTSQAFAFSGSGLGLGFRVWRFEVYGLRVWSWGLKFKAGNSFYEISVDAWSLALSPRPKNSETPSAP